MFRLKHKKLLSRGMNLLFSLVVVAMLLEEYLLKPGKTVETWTAITFLVVMGAVFFALPLEFREQQLVNRWYRAAYWAACIVSTLIGALILLSVVVLSIIGPAPGQFPVGGVLVIIGMALLLVGILVVGGLGATGYIAQGTEETRQWARSLGRTNGEGRNGPTQEDASS